MATQEYPSASSLWGYLLNKSICPCKTLASIDNTADWLGEVCHNVEKEPSLFLPLTGEQFEPLSANTHNDARGGIKARGPKHYTIHPVFIHSTTNMTKRTGRS